MSFLKSLLNTFRAIRFWDLAVGVPAGMVIFMSTFLFVRLYEKLFGSNLAFFGLATVVAALVGSLLRVVRFSKAPATALVAGIAGAALLGWLWATVYSLVNPAVWAALPGLLLVALAPWSIATLLRPKGHA